MADHLVMGKASAVSWHNCFLQFKHDEIRHSPILSVGYTALWQWGRSSVSWPQVTCGKRLVPHQGGGARPSKRETW